MTAAGWSRMSIYICHVDIHTSSRLNSVNKATQYVPSTLSDEERLSILDSQACRDFLESAIIRCKRELQTNETIDLFKDEFLEFMDEEVSLGNRAENNLEVSGRCC